ncbi:MAG: type II toxin-antitoxin system VapC family toxin [Candidatus Rokuibacteriota bacterium]
MGTTARGGQQPLIHLDTSVLVDALAGKRRSARELRRVVEEGERIAISTLALYEWLRGPRVEAELADQEELLPTDQAVPFGPREAARAAQLYRSLSRARGREFDLCVAACALVQEASLWTLNPGDFRDIPGLVLRGV